MKKRYFVFILAVFLVCCSMFCSCSDQIVKNGLDKLYEDHGEIGDFELTGYFFIKKEFMDKYSYKNGDFQFVWYEPHPFIGTVERSFAWLSYDTETYVQAKEAMLNDRQTENEQFDGKTAFGFTFYLNHANSLKDSNTFPHWFTAFGCNDEAQTLVFIGLYVNFDSEEYANCTLAETDLEAFIQHFYGEWYDWNSGIEVGKTTDEITAGVA